MSKKVLVTGAAGFIGSHLAERLVRDGHSVKALVRYNSAGRRGWLDTVPQEIASEIEFFDGDIRDSFYVKESMKDVAVVYNLAALIAIPYSYHAPNSYVETNISGALNVVHAARENGNVRVIQMSTSEVYGTAQYVPINEKHPLKGQSPYSASKIGADQIALSFYYAFHTPVTVARPFNTFGPRQSLRAVIPSIIVQLLKGDGNLDLGNIKATRDFNYVGYTTEMLTKIADCDATIGETVNIGTGLEISIEDTAKLAGEILGKPVKLKIDPERLRPEDSEVYRLCGDSSKLFSLIGGKMPADPVADFKRELKTTIEWFSRPENLAHYDGAGYRL